MIWLYVVLALLGLLAVAVLTHAYRSIRNFRKVNEAAIALRLEDIPALAKECQNAFAILWGFDFTQMRPDEIAMALEAAVWRSRHLRHALGRPGQRWRFALPVGAFLGELLVAHAKGKWLRDARGVPCITVPCRRVTLCVYPFTTVFKHRAVGRRGELFATITKVLANEAPASAKPDWWD